MQDLRVGVPDIELESLAQNTFVILPNTVSSQLFFFFPYLDRISVSPSRLNAVLVLLVVETALPVSRSLWRKSSYTWLWICCVCERR